MLWISLLWLLAGGAGVVFAYRRFGEPLLVVLRDLATARRAAPEEAAPSLEGAAGAAAAAGPEPDGAPRAPSAREEAGASRDSPFGFIGERDLPKLIFLLRASEPATAAVVLQYLPPDLASKTLSALGPEARSQIVGLMSKVIQLTPEQVRPVEESVRRRIDYLVGGEEKLVEVLDKLPPDMQADLLGALALKDPGMTARLKERIVLIEDLGCLDSAGWKLLCRRVPLRALAVVLKGYAGLQERVLPNLAPGMREWLTQEIELSDPPVADALAAESRRILDQACALIHEGKLELKKEAHAPGGNGGPR